MLAGGGPGDSQSTKGWALEKKAEHRDPLQRHTESGLCLRPCEPPLGWCLCSERLGTIRGAGRLLLFPLCLKLKLPAARSSGQDLRSELAHRRSSQVPRSKPADAAIH